MNKYAAHKVVGPDGEETEVWHYTRENGVEIICWLPCTETCMHKSPDEVYAHVREYRLNKATFLDDVPDAETLVRCRAEGCRAYTSGYVRFKGAGQSVVLCEKHRTREEASKHLVVGPSYSSY